MPTLKASSQAIAVVRRRKDSHVKEQRRRAADEERRRREIKAGRIVPTQERIAKGDLQQQAYEGSMRYRPKDDVLTVYKGKWPDLEAAFHRLLDDSFAAEVSGITANYNPTNSRAPGPRIGGLGEAHQRKHDAYARFDFVMSRLTHRSRRMCEWLILREPKHDGQVINLEAAGSIYLLPHIKDKLSHRMYALGCLHSAGNELVQLYNAYDMQTKVKSIIRKEIL